SVVSPILLHEPAGILLGRATDGKAIDFDGRNADAHRHGLPVLTASADAFVELQIVAHHGDPRQDIGTVADQRSAFDRRRDVPVFNHVRFGSSKYKLAVGDIDLAAAEVHGVDAALHRADDVFRIVLPRQHISIPHAWHGNVLVALAPSVAGVGDAH